MRVATVVLAAFAVVALGGVVGCLSLSRYTSGKLERMRMIRGEVPGATLVVGRVVSSRAVGRQCELTIEVEGTTSRQWAEPPACEALLPGSAATLARTPGDPGLELQNGTYVSDGNVRFDETLLVIERGGAGAFAVGALALGLAAAATRRRRGGAA